MLLGTSWSSTISPKNKSAMLVASSILWHRIKCIFENLSTTTKIESLPRFDLSKPKMKSIEMSTHGSLGKGKGIYKPCSWVLDFVFPTSYVFITYVLHICFFRSTKMLIQTTIFKMPHQPAPMCFTYQQFTHRT
jgi:hypothetical protein